MNALNDFHFIRPMALLLIPIALAVWWFVKTRKDPLRGWRNIVEPHLLSAITINPDGLQNRHGVGMLIAWLLAAIAISGPTWKPEASPFADDPVPTMVLLKAGETMTESDLTPNRMEIARLKVVDFCEQRKGQPVGLIAYAGTAHLVLPPTRDTAVVASMATEIAPAIMPKQGDELVSALELAQATLGQSAGSILIVADTITPDQNQRLAEFQSANRIHFLGVTRPGTPEETDLKNAASLLGAQLTLITPDEEDVSLIAKRVARTPVGTSAAGEGTRWAETGWWLVPVLAVFVLVSFRRHDNGEESGK